MSLHTLVVSLRKLGISIEVSNITLKSVPWWQTSEFRYEDGRYEIDIREGSRHNILAHEIGHYLVNQFNLCRRKLYRKFFAWDPGYYGTRVAVFWLMGGMTTRVKGYPSHYACISGEEEFCELFRLLADTGWVARDEDKKVEKKMRVVLMLLEQIAKKRKRRRA